MAAKPKYRTRCSSCSKVISTTAFKVIYLHNRSLSNRTCKSCMEIKSRIKSPLHADRDKAKYELIEKWRRNPPASEVILMDHLQKLGFIHQFLVCGYIADFANIKSRLIVECDGKGHNKVSDAYRDEVLRSRGWKVLRFPNDRIYDDREKVRKEISAWYARSVEPGVRAPS